MSHTDRPVPRHAGSDFSSRHIELSAVALPISDQLVVIAPDGSVAALDAAGRRLWEALATGCNVNDLVAACVGEGDLREGVARANISRALASWRRLGLIDAADFTSPEAGSSPAARPVVARPVGRAPELDA